MDLGKESMNQFVDELITKKGLTNLDKEVIAQIKSDLLERLENRLNASILAEMPADKIEEFEKILDSGNDSEIQDFIKANVVNLEQILAVEIINFQKLYLS